MVFRGGAVQSKGSMMSEQRILTEKFTWADKAKWSAIFP